MALAPGGDPEDGAERVPCHDRTLKPERISLFGIGDGLDDGTLQKAYTGFDGGDDKMSYLGDLREKGREANPFLKLMGIPRPYFRINLCTRNFVDARPRKG